MNVNFQDSAKSPLVLVVDDTPEILSLINNLLRDLSG
jgi:CheY-like chemotaxis protein